jgi:nuclear GTP-binding protein
MIPLDGTSDEEEDDDEEESEDEDGSDEGEDDEDEDESDVDIEGASDILPSDGESDPPALKKRRKAR